MIGAAVPTRISAPQQNVVRCHAAWAAPTRAHHHTALDANSHARRSVSTRTVSSPTALAAHRFGFGASDADLAAASGDARGWLAGQLDTTSADKALLAQSFGALPGSDRTGSVFPSMLRRAGLMGGLGRAGGGVAASAGTGESRALRQLLPYLQAELEARMRHAVATPTPLVDRLVWFWSNHLTVSARRIGVYALVGPYEREAIRPHVLGRFEDLLLAAAKHPAMQIYLDNFRSVGPNTSAVGSGFGAQRRTGVNENLARELLELHTLGDRSAYTQADVGQLALALTGWGLGFGTGFRYDDSAHEPGTRTLLQRRYDQHGQQQAEAMLIDLARHPATARHLARKLLRHFGAATPSATEVERVAQIYLQSGGQLRTVMLASRAPRRRTRGRRLAHARHRAAERRGHLCPARVAGRDHLARRFARRLDGSVVGCARPRCAAGTPRLGPQSGRARRGYAGCTCTGARALRSAAGRRHPPRTRTRGQRRASIGLAAGVTGAAASMSAARLSRRDLLLASLGLTGSSGLSWAASADALGDRRLVFVILRGGLDGLTAVPAIGDPAFEATRGALALPSHGDGAALPLNDLFGLHPLLPQMHAMYRQRELLVVHATATPYRERSHFDAQNLLESGGIAPFALDSGSTGRCIRSRPAAPTPRWPSDPPCRWCCVGRPPCRTRRPRIRDAWTTI
jgi:hypothetical protein